MEDLPRQSENITEIRTFETFLRSLKCGICWGYLKKPHTLSCGHSFCMKCIYHLAKTTREQKRRISFYTPKIHFPCPSCRQQHNTRGIIKKTVCVNFVLQEVSEFWRHHINSAKTNNKIEMRSIASQGYEDGKDPIQDEKDPEAVSCTEFHYVMPRLESNFLSLKEENPDNNGGESDVVSESSSGRSTESSTEESEIFNYHVGHIVLRRAGNRQNDRANRGGIGILYREVYTTMHEMFRNPNRAIMSLIWVGYTFSIMLIANNFFPYMMLYSLLFLLILYAESLQNDGRQLY